jgi:endonuclease/exonuclease/phosphatase family metal-dependent hydrolase
MLRLMTLNLNDHSTKHGPWPDRAQVIAQVMRSAAPDILLFQAVRQHPGVDDGQDQAARLAAMVSGYPHRELLITASADDGSIDGMAILSRHPMAKTGALDLTGVPGCEDGRPRRVQAALFELADGPFMVFNAHLSWVAQQAGLNAREVLSYIGSFPGRRLLMGDLNQTPDSEVFLPWREAGWTDIWARLRPGESGWTFESNDPRLRIDYAWASPELLPAVRAIGIVADRPSGAGARASDHLGLMVELALSP